MGEEVISYYAVYIQVGKDLAGQPEWNDEPANFIEERNALAYKRQLEEEGETVHIQETTLQGSLSEDVKAYWFDDYEPNY